MLNHNLNTGIDIAEMKRLRGSLKPTAIVLFTDGVPSDGEGKGDLAQQARILTVMVGAHIPAHVIAVSNYFDSHNGSFMHNLASQKSSL